MTSVTRGTVALAERVQQLGAAAHHAAPLLVDTGQVAGHVDDDDQRNAERVAQPHETCCLLGAFGVQAAAEAQRVVGEHADGAARTAGRGRSTIDGAHLAWNSSNGASSSSSASTSGCTS